MFHQESFAKTINLSVSTPISAFGRTDQMVKDSKINGLLGVGI